MILQRKSKGIRWLAARLGRAHGEGVRLDGCEWLEAGFMFLCSSVCLMKRKSHANAFHESYTSAGRGGTKIVRSFGALGLCEAKLVEEVSSAQARVL